MRINCHSHVFNLNTVFTTETLKILLRRLKEGMIPGYLIKILEKLFKKGLSEKRTISRKEILIETFNAIKKSKEFKKSLKKINKPFPEEMRIVFSEEGQSLDEKILEASIDKFSEWFLDTEKDASKSSLSDYLGYISLALAPNIDNVTDKLMKEIGKNDGAIVLMMDITNGKGKDEKMFTKQTKFTSLQVLRYPGRIFPFFAVNPIRKDYFERMVKATKKQGFVGVKLYPSLGYEINLDTKMDRVFEYCSTYKIPILQHCNQSGFYSKKSYIDNSNPAHWRPVLQKYPKLRICFGHFGGDKNLTKKKIAKNSWTQTILNMMVEFKGQVYADIAYHIDTMDGGKKEKNYISNLKKLIADKRYKQYILWGTDFVMIRIRLGEKSYWHYFKRRFTKKEFSQISNKNAHAFLGFTQNGKREENFSHYIDFVVKNYSRLESKPAKWLEKNIAKMYPDLY